LLAQQASMPRSPPWIGCGGHAWQLLLQKPPRDANVLPRPSWLRRELVPLYRVLRFDEGTRTISEHLNIEATNALAAALMVCSGPLVPTGPLELFRAYVTLEGDTNDFAMFFAPRGSHGTFGRRLPRAQ
jgi:hypothetical protein